MATIDKLYKSMGLPMNIKRGNPWPLDASSLWYSYDEMKAYAEDAAGVSYVGQVLALVDEEKNIATAYIIADANGTLKEVGSGPIVDNKTIIIDEESDELGLKDFGKRFYKYIPEVKDEEGNVIVQSGYELTEVSTNDPWVAGLEPRVVSENGEFVLGWFEPNPTTIEGVNNQVSGLQTTLNDLQQVLTGLESEVGSPADGSTQSTGLYAALDKKANAADVYTKTEVDSAIAVSITNADHLRRKIVTSYSDITQFIDEKGADEASKYIFMVPEEDTTADGNIYEEYIVINGVIEVVGKWATDLSGYVTSDALDTKLEDYITSTGLDTKLESYVTESELSTQLTEYVTDSTLAVSLSGKVNKEEGKRLITEEEAQKLASLDTAGEENFVKSVSDDFTVDTDGQLALNKDSLDLVNNQTIKDLLAEINGIKGTANSNAASLSLLQQSLENNISAVESLQTSVGALQTAVETNKTDIATLKSGQTSLTDQLSALTNKVTTNETTIGNILANLNNYVLQENYNKDIAEIRDILTWKDMEETSTNE